MSPEPLALTYHVRAATGAVPGAFAITDRNTGRNRRQRLIDSPFAYARKIPVRRFMVKTKAVRMAVHPCPARGHCPRSGSVKPRTVFFE